MFLDWAVEGRSLEDFEGDILELGGSRWLVLSGGFWRWLLDRWAWRPMGLGQAYVWNGRFFYFIRDWADLWL